MSTGEFTPVFVDPPQIIRDPASDPRGIAVSVIVEDEGDDEPMRFNISPAIHRNETTELDLSSANDDRAIRAFADHYLVTQQNMRNTIGVLLNKAPTALEFTMRECAQMRAVGLDELALQNGSAEYPIPQFYDYIRTVRRLLTQLSQYQSQIDNLEQIGSRELLAKFKSEIFHPTFLPWELLETYEQSRLVDAAGLRLGETKISQYNPSDQRLTTRDKSAYENAFDESELLRPGPLASIVALSQGLFQVSLSRVHFEDIVCPVTNKVAHPIGDRWINAMQSTLYNTQPLSGGVVVTGGGKTVDIGKLPDPEEETFKLTSILFRKTSNRQLHLSNWLSLMLTADESRANNLGLAMPLLDDAGRKMYEAMFDDICSQLATGGPIGAYIWYWVRDGTNNLWGIAPAANERVETDTGFVVQVQNFGPEGIPLRLYFVPVDRVRAQMLQLRGKHPIFACPQLADAYSTSGLGDYLMQIYNDIQRRFASALQTTRIGRTELTPAALIRSMVNGPGMSMICPGPNNRTVFRNTAGEMVDQDQAIMTDLTTGKTFLRPSIIPGTQQCVPLSEIDIPSNHQLMLGATPNQTPLAAISIDQSTALGTANLV